MPWAALELPNSIFANFPQSSYWLENMEGTIFPCLIVCSIVTLLTVLLLLRPLKILKLSFLAGTWTVYGLSLDCVWTVSGLCLDCLWSVSWLSLNCFWTDLLNDWRTEFVLDMTVFVLYTRVWRIFQYLNTIQIVGPSSSICIRYSDFLNTE